MKTVLITGATVNTGYGIAKKFASENWNVVITGRDIDRVPAAAERLQNDYPDVTVLGYVLNAVRPDNTIDEEAVTNLFSDLDRKGLFVECLVLNAANLGIRQKIFENPLSDFVNVLQTNVTMNYLLIETAARRMKEEKTGSVVFINSNTAYRAIPDRIAYCTSKGAQLSMMRALALDLLWI